jgi:transcriptional regulator with XRE-family HTH domain
MMKTMSNETAKLLLDHYLDFQKRKGELATQAEFADYLGIHKTTLSNLNKGERPLSKKMAILLAEKTSDPRFYDVAGLARPDPALSYVSKSWDNLTQEQQDEIQKNIKDYLKGNH